MMNRRTCEMIFGFRTIPTVFSFCAWEIGNLAKSLINPRHRQSTGGKKSRFPFNAENPAKWVKREISQKPQ